MPPRGGNRLNAIFDLAKRCGQGAKAARKGFVGPWCPGGTCFAQALKPSLNAVFRRGQGRMAKGERCTGRVWGPSETCFVLGLEIRLNAEYSTLAKRSGQRAKAAQEGFVS